RRPCRIRCKQSQSLSFCLFIWRALNDHPRYRIRVSVDIVAEKLQCLFGWQERLSRLLQAFKQSLLRKTVLLPREEAKDALTKFRVGVCCYRPQRCEVVRAPRFELDHSEACGLECL